MAKKIDIHLYEEVLTVLRLSYKEWDRMSDGGVAVWFDVKCWIGTFRFVNGSDTNNRETYMIYYYAHGAEQPTAYFSADPETMLKLIGLWLVAENPLSSPNSALETLEHWLTHMALER